MITVTVCDYPDGVLARVSPHLWIVLTNHPKHPANVTGFICSRCGRRLMTHQIAGWPEYRLLRCPCLWLLYAPHYTGKKLSPHWAGFIQLKQRIEIDLSPAGRN